MAGQRAKGRGFEIALLALALTLTLGVRLVFHACGPKEDGMWMHCHTAELAVMGLGAALCALGAGHLFVPAKGKLALDGVMLALSAVAMAVPGGVVPLCMMETMRCRAVMRPAVLVLGTMLAAALLADGACRVLQMKKSGR